MEMDLVHPNGNRQHPEGHPAAQVRRNIGERRWSLRSVVGTWHVQRRVLHLIHGYLDPRKRTVQRGLLLLLCVAAASFDPVFFYIPMIDLYKKCLEIDRNLAITMVVLRTLADLLHLAVWVVYNHKAFCKARSRDSSSRSRSEEEDGFEVFSKEKEIGIEILSILPLSQAMTIAILRIQGSPKKPHAVLMLKFAVLLQYLIRASRIYPSYRRATVNSPTLRSNNVWFGAAFNLALYMIAAHVVGAFWYLLSVGRYIDCWKRACSVHAGCDMASLYCGNANSSADKGYLDVSCPISQTTDTAPFDFGIYLKALQSGIVGTTDFFLKLCFCFSWALRNLSSFGVALDTSPYKWETLFAICVTLASLVLFALLIGNMQTYLQSKTQKEMKFTESSVGAHGMEYLEKEDLERMQMSQQKLRDSLLTYLPFALLPSELQDQVMGCPKKEWPGTRNEFNLESMIGSIPEELGKKIKHHLCLLVLSQVKLLEGLDPLSKEFLCKQAELKVFPPHAKIIKKNTPVDNMILVVTGQLKYHQPDNQTHDFLEEHLRHVLGLSSPLPVHTVMALTVVEAFTFNVEKVKKLLPVATPQSFPERKEMS
ncbi:hypothetical protein MLD38_002395 [Melastoma candidum]|uniref:Uncharacterized protein n=1 Tax=Melastoma candidum TaxID=119954 RepID=A0ACB9RYN2_9MYRT|nr:hypothetical protein MLD38_002395 [Melastoma candidum]